MSERWSWQVDGREIAASAPFDVTGAVAGRLREAFPDVPVYEGVVVEPDRTRLPQGMIESTTEYDYDELPERLRADLERWCDIFRAWDREQR